MGLFTTYINTALALEAWSSTATGPAAPTNLRTTATTSSTVTLAWDGAAGTQALERATVTSGVTGAYSTVYTNAAQTTTDGPLTFGTTYKWRVAVTVNGVTSAYSTPLQLTVGGGVTNQLTPAHSDYTENQSNLFIGATPMPDSNARLFFDTDHTSVSMTGASTYDGDVSLFRGDGTLIGSYTVGSGANVSALPGTGTRRFYYATGQRQRTNETGGIQGTGITQLTFSGGTTVAVAKPTFDTKVAVLGNSITVRGGGTQHSSVFALAPSLRTATRSVTANAYGSRRNFNAIFADADWAITKGQLVSAVVGATNQIIYWELTGINDYGSGATSLADLVAKTKVRLTDLHTALPSARIILQTLLLTAYEGQLNSNAPSPNTSTQTPAQNRAAFAALKNDLAWLEVQDGLVMLDNTGQLEPQPDGVHPTAAGNLIYFARVGAAIQNRAGTFTTTFVNSSDTLFSDASNGTGTTSKSNGLILTPGLGISGQPQVNNAKQVSNDIYDLRGHAFVGRIDQVPSGADSSGGAYMWAGAAGFGNANNLLMVVVGGVLYGQFGDAHGQFQQIVYNAASMKWWRIRVSADGSTFYCDYSADGNTWTNLLTQALGGIDMSAVRLIFYTSQGDQVNATGTMRVGYASVA